MGDCHAGICGSRGVRFPPATRPPGWIDRDPIPDPTAMRVMVGGWCSIPRRTRPVISSRALSADGSRSSRSARPR